MTRGSQVTTISQEVRAGWNIMIWHEKSGRGKMLPVAGCIGDETFARLLRKVTMIHRIACELTPSPRGSGED